MIAVAVSSLVASYVLIGLIVACIYATEVKQANPEYVGLAMLLWPALVLWYFAHSTYVGFRRVCRGVGSLILTRRP